MARAPQSYKEIATQHGELQVQIRELRSYLEKERPEPHAEDAYRWASDLTGRLVCRGAGEWCAVHGAGPGLRDLPPCGPGCPPAPP